VSPDEQRLVDLVRKAQRRARVLLALEVLGWSGTAAAIVLAAGAAARWRAPS